MRITLNPSRIVSAALMGIGFGWYMHRGYVTWNQRGKEAFLTHESQRFDHYMASPHPIAVTIFGALIGAAFAFGIYELITAALSAVLHKRAPETQNTNGR